MKYIVKSHPGDGYPQDLEDAICWGLRRKKGYGLLSDSRGIEERQELTDQILSRLLVQLLEKEIISQQELTNDILSYDVELDGKIVTLDED